MIELDEAGAENICSLLNQVMGLQPYFGSGEDLAEYLDALTVLEAQGEILVRAYRPVLGGTDVDLGVVAGSASRPASAFRFDPDENCWRWQDSIWQMVELPEE